ncbi:hypothetical protein P3602_06580 [Vibrio parahaemolyticus]|uniref:hypothetical protein n=1 Tax=Vibrio parahaemolyticus TaxID=670 RepID=UPI001B82E278|nr:hypothetical protein [Vibrio parahaemolyticus]MBE3746752.1 hypothetical protein [Vibrio parahaemolyticus]MDF4369950.1 hypothetical protein [Vibrio parahaemolyticus]MDF4512149.1 hypothetical protein [Vibrio parahaemolyticus]MDF4770868.1 hypothetical protein [Vibrio parahaemolyticus]MDF5053675.1 hypothetical protein [Vibrio parahaemolyticus]
MNIALPAFFILLLILPGYIYLNAYERRENNTLEKKPFEASSATAIVCAFVIQFIYAGLVHSLINPIDFALCLKILSGIKLTSDEVSQLTPDIWIVGLYFIVLFYASHGAGKLMQSIIFKCNPYKDSKFAFDTPWYYELKGFLSREKDAQFIKISATQDTSEGTYIYYGVLQDFYLTKDGQLDRLVISEATRRHIKEDKTPANVDEISDNRFYEIKGDRLILKYENIINLNVEYYYITQKDV